jgi:NAD(P)-dependent dehydrogenase (short-subunit alcohol dehydrogenase family)
MKTPAEWFDLSGRIALITGGSRDLGRAMALGFAWTGADAVISSRRQATCEDLAKESRRRPGARLWHTLPSATATSSWDSSTHARSALGSSTCW